MTINPQDNNAGNLGDLLKHYWLLRLLVAVTSQRDVSSIEYFESHSGAGFYPIDDKRRKKIDDDRLLVDPNPANWRLFNRLQDRLANGLYSGSCRLALRFLRDWGNAGSKREVKAQLWEKDPEVQARLANALAALEPMQIAIHREVCPMPRFSGAAVGRFPRFSRCVVP